MAKRTHAVGRPQKTKSHKTAKRLEIKRLMLEEKESKRRGNKQFFTYKKSTDFLSVHELNTKVAENNFNQVNKITFDELDKPSNFDGIISGKEVNINCTFFIEDK